MISEAQFQNELEQIIKNAIREDVGSGDYSSLSCIPTTASGKAKLLVKDNGIIAGVGAVLGFVPQLIILFLCISILETTGYMSRVTFLLDKLFKKFGLSGETLVPFIVGLRM